MNAPAKKSTYAVTRYFNPAMRLSTPAAGRKRVSLRQLVLDLPNAGDLRGKLHGRTTIDDRRDGILRL
jgi:hypothetical protein